MANIIPESDNFFQIKTCNSVMMILCCLMSLGGGLGLFMGLFLGALDNPIMQDQMTGRQQFLYTAKQMGRRSWASCKGFAVMGAVFSAAECVVEKVLIYS